MELMKQDQIKRIEELMDRFFEGASSSEEEKELYLFFSNDAVPQDLVQYRQLFAYFESGLEQDILQTAEATAEILSSETIEFLAETTLFEDYPEGDTDNNNSGNQSVESVPKIKLRSRLPKRTGLLRRLVMSGAAALLLIFIGVVSHKIASETDNSDFDPYEGSFIIRGGIKITDVNQIRPELEATMKQVLYKEHRAELEFLQVELEHQNKYINLINSFPEGPEREAVIKTLQTGY